MAKDARGNELKVGDQVALEIPSTKVLGNIVQITQGGIITGMKRGGQEQLPGELTVAVHFLLQVHPQQPVLPNVLKLHQQGEEKGLIELQN
jgi:hypothetical protein